MTSVSSSLMTGPPRPAIQELLVPSINFAMVCPGVYRSGYPTKKNYRFLCALRLRSILYLCPEEYAESNLKFCEESGIEILRFPTEGNKEPFMDISEALMHRILSVLIDTRKHPVLIHCNKGKHRTGTVVACLRLLQGWSLVSILQEYRSFAGDKARVVDQQYVELYYPIVRVTPPHVAEWVCITPRVTVVADEAALQRAEVLQFGWSLVAPAETAKEKTEKEKVSNGSTGNGASSHHATNPTTTTTTAIPTVAEEGVGQEGNGGHKATQTKTSVAATATLASATRTVPTGSTATAGVLNSANAPTGVLNTLRTVSSSGGKGKDGRKDNTNDGKRRNQR